MVLHEAFMGRVTASAVLLLTLSSASWSGAYGAGAVRRALTLPHIVDPFHEHGPVKYVMSDLDAPPRSGSTDAASTPAPADTSVDAPGSGSGNSDDAVHAAKDHLTHTPSDPQSTHQWQARKLEERAKVEKRRKEEARALTRRDADRRARTSDRGHDPFEAELDRMSDAEAMNRLDDVPISDLDTDYSSDERGASRRGGGRATDNDDSDLDDGLTPMERAMARAARAPSA